MQLSHSTLSVLTAAAIVGSGVMAGLFFVFSNVVMRSLTSLPAGNAVAAFNAINVQIVNPLFLLFFLGTPLLCGVLVVHAVLNFSTPGTACLIAGGVVYLVGALLVTVAINIPMNNALAAVDSASASAADAWEAFVRPWTLWNHVRTLASVVSMVLLICGLVQISAKV